MADHFSPGAIPYFVKKIAHTAPNSFHVINSSTRITLSAWDSLEEAKKVCKDLNKMIRSQRSKKAVKGMS